MPVALGARQKGCEVRLHLTVRSERRDSPTNVCNIEQFYATWPCSLPDCCSFQGWSRYASRMLCRGSCPAPIPSVEIDPIDERIRNLCTKAASARGREVERVFSEMRAALREHAQFVRDRRHNPQSLAKRRLTLPRAASLPSKGCRLTGRSATSVRFMSLR
jgi:hypothetical protein